MADFNISDEKLTELLSGLDDNIEVPDAAGKAWRAAIKRESRKYKARRTVRRFASLAAALIVLIGCVFLFRNSGIIKTDNDIQAEKVYHFNSAAQPLVMLAADGADDSALFDTSAQAAAEMERMVTVVCEFGVSDISEAKTAINAAMEGLDAYVESSKEEKLSFSTVIRVKNDDVDKYISNLRTAYPDMKAEVTSESTDETVYDLDARLNSAYETVNVLKAQLVSADATTATGIYEQLETLYADIDALQALYNKHTNDLKYAHVTVNAKVNALMPRISNALSNVVNGFGTDMAITVILLLPVTAILAACVIFIIKKAHGHKM